MRVVTAVWAVWLGAALSKPMALHPMPMQSAGAMAGMHEMPGMDQTQGGADLGADLVTDHTPPHGSSTDCSRICNGCCAPPSIAPSSFATGIESRVLAPRPAIIIEADARGPAALPAYSHPFANGPPAESLA